ncbi:hypothetical protein Hdeb2414_s0069g00771791 [Helianthus debilis subsp. tardiflorus]|nr:hypothetical protein HanLR1_Chr05g0192041 [Helianthus annuus]
MSFTSVKSKVIIPSKMIFFFYHFFSNIIRKIPRDLTEASLSGAGLSLVAAVSMLFLFGLVGSSPLLLV